MLILTPADFTLTLSPGTRVDWVRSTDGRTVLEHGSCAPALLPRDEDCVWVVPPTALSWHRVTLPKLPPSRVRAALDGLLEEQLLGDPAELHLALAPGGQPGRPVWVAACRKAWLQSWLQALEAAQRPVNRIVAAQWPEQAPVHWVHEQDGQPWVLSTGAAGVSCLPLDSFAQVTHRSVPFGDATQAVEAAESSDRTLAEPAWVAQAEQVLDRRVQLCSRTEWLLRCTQPDGNLAQFDLSLSAAMRRSQHLRRWLREGRSAPQWRAARWGLVALLGAQLLGLNVWAWQERQTLQAKEQMLGTILQSRFPEVSLVLDAPVQMQRELDRLRRASGALSLNDLESQLASLGQVTQGSLPLGNLDYTAEGTRLTLGADVGERWPSWQAALARQGLQASLADQVLSLRPTPANTPSP